MIASTKERSAACAAIKGSRLCAQHQPQHVASYVIHEPPLIHCLLNVAAGLADTAAVRKIFAVMSDSDGVHCKDRKKDFSLCVLCVLLRLTQNVLE